MEEDLNGISHLFEHLIIKRVRAVAHCYTGDDYILIKVLRFQTVHPLLRTIECFRLRNDELELEKTKIIGEIKERGNSESEEFFRLAWHGTRYFSSPLGNIESIRRISLNDIDEYRRQVLEQGIYVRNITRIWMSKENKAGSAGRAVLKIMRSNEFLFNGKEFRSIIFTGNRDVLHYVEEVIKRLLPGHFVQLSEKLAASALIIEKDIVFRLRTYECVTAAGDFNRRSIVRDIHKKQLDHGGLRLAQLESRYFYNKSWRHRVKRLRKEPVNDIERAIEMLYA